MNKLGRVEASQQLCVIDSSRLVQGRFSAGTHTDTIMVEADTVKQQLENIRGVKELDRVEFQTLLSPEGAQWKGLTALLTCIRNSINQEGVSDSPLAMSYLKQALVTTLIEKIPNNFTHALLNTNILMTPRHVTKTVEYIHAHADKPLMIADLARHACTSARNLQMGFRSHKNMTPMQYLREVRLLAVRKELVNEEVRLTWQKIAHKWGFTDTTLFSRYYKNRFNESPAQTQYAKKGILH